MPRKIQAPCASLADPAWPLCLRRAQAQMSGMSRRGPLPLSGQDAAPSRRKDGLPKRPLGHCAGVQIEALHAGRIGRPSACRAGWFPNSAASSHCPRDRGRRTRRSSPRHSAKALNRFRGAQNRAAHSARARTRRRSAGEASSAPGRASRRGQRQGRRRRGRRADGHHGRRDGRRYRLGLRRGSWGMRVWGAGTRPAQALARTSTQARQKTWAISACQGAPPSLTRERCL